MGISIGGPRIDFADPIHQRAMRALTATGHYDETPDSFEWQVREAADIAGAVRSCPSGLADAVYAILEDTGLHDTSQPAEATCLRKDATAIASALVAGLGGDHHV